MKSSYKNLAAQIGIHFLIMYAVMFTMVDTFSDVYLNINTFYMTGMMVMPMVVLMIISMSSMYKDKRANFILCALSLVLFVAFFAFERKQTLVGDEQFIRSMIPHHSGAILMCQKSSIQDTELKTLCEKIAEGQRSEIEQMRLIFARLRSRP